MQKTFSPFSSFLLEEGGPWRDGFFFFFFLNLKEECCRLRYTNNNTLWLCKCLGLE